MLWLTSPLFASNGIAHGFTQRSNGEPPFQNLNLDSFFEPARQVPNDPWRTLAQAASAAPSDFVLAKQVHGDRIVRADRHWTSRPEADGVVSSERGLAAAVRVADCAPLLLCAPRIGAVAAVHSGWRGARLSIAARGVEALVALGAEPHEILAAIGPCIRRCCYAVSPELARDFAETFGPGAAELNAASPRVDLPFAVRAALRSAGVADAHIDVLDACTSCDASRFFSHRRDRGQTGRHVAFIFPPN